MGLSELPSELFRLTNVKRLGIYDNNICSLPSDIAHLPKNARDTLCAIVEAVGL
jgi:Leucine-rich repeat (LRR) protein